MEILIVVSFCKPQPMKHVISIILIVVVISCSSQENKTQAVEDSTVSAIDSITAPPVIVATTPPEQTSIVLDGGLTVKDGDTIMYVSNQWAFISDPYDFSLDPDVIKELLGEEAQSKEEQYEAGEDYEAFSYYTVTYKDTELSFYSYPGKHFSSITTPLLQLKNGIRIGMTKQDFLKAMNFTGDSVRYATLFNLSDDYGYMEFRFRADTLNFIYANWEEGD